MNRGPPVQEATALTINPTPLPGDFVATCLRSFIQHQLIIVRKHSGQKAKVSRGFGPNLEIPSRALLKLYKGILYLPTCQTVSYNASIPSVLFFPMYKLWQFSAITQCTFLSIFTKS